MAHSDQDLTVFITNRRLDSYANGYLEELKAEARIVDPGMTRPGRGQHAVNRQASAPNWPPPPGAGLARHACLFS